jgi:hypothetical protein
VRTIGKSNVQLEANEANKSAVDPGKPAGSATAKLSKSPFVAKTTEQLGENDAPPKRYEVLKPNLQVEPQPRKVGGHAKVTTGTPQATDKSIPQGQPTGKIKVQSQGDSKCQQQGGSKGQKQSGTGGQPQSASKGQPQGGSNGQPQSATGSQPQGTPQNQPKDDSKREKK